MRYIRNRFYLNKALYEFPAAALKSKVDGPTQALGRLSILQETRYK
jgi:hypothetical protein